MELAACKALDIKHHRPRSPNPHAFVLSRSRRCSHSGTEGARCHCKTSAARRSGYAGDRRALSGFVSYHLPSTFVRHSDKAGIPEDVGTEMKHVGAGQRRNDFVFLLLPAPGKLREQLIAALREEAMLSARLHNWHLAAIWKTVLLFLRS